METKFNVTHIGGRSGTIEFPKDTVFNDSINYSIFEADKTCIEQIRRSNPFAQVYPFCIDEKNGEKDFYLNLNKYTSSFLESNDTNLKFYSQFNKTDMLLNEVLRPIKSIKMKTYSLDYLIEKEKIPKINFLSLDTQGSEYEILKGSIECLKKSIVAIKTEINFVEIYKNSKLFSDIDKLLCEHGFFLAELNSFDNYYKERIPLEFRGKQIPLQGEAVYFYNPDNIKLDNKINFVDKLEKLAFAFVVYGFTDLSFRSLNRIHLNKLNFNQSTSYQKFLKEFYFKIKDKEMNLPKLWHENLADNYSEKVSAIDKSVDLEYFKKNIYSKAIIRLASNPLLFFKISIKYILNRLKLLFLELTPIRITIKKNSKFSNYLKKYKLLLAAERINSQKY